MHTFCQECDFPSVIFVQCRFMKPLTLDDIPLFCCTIGPLHHQSIELTPFECNQNPKHFTLFEFQLINPNPNG
ncbi:hypothetical protein L1987_78251 [Smallanthus sonchifolius]|uniref:Uncharacterized protein n=1 Tax=Smallanthus sonchifolius TaxID=185202 RepID=A0ACB8ZB73_9ASTR|nr:hypothetical protein L1987_78251 [Smallanthus sonchifolius]